MPTPTTLYVMRHAKSNWANVATQDFDRTLSLRGNKDAAAMGRWMRASGFQPTKIVSSSALRARDTAELLRRQFNPEGVLEVVCEEGLYLAELDDILSLIQVHLCNGLLVVGHNPGFESLVRHLDPCAARDISQVKLMPTCALYVFKIEQNGTALKPITSPGCARQIAHQRPKWLDAEGELQK